MTDVIVPHVGESVTSGIIANWIKKEGEFVEVGSDLFELETDKATMPIPAPISGVLHIGISEGEEVSVDTVVAHIDETQMAGTAPSTTDTPKINTPQANTQVRNETAPPDQIPQQDLSPAVRRLTTEHRLDPRKITGTGRDQRITKEDVLNFIATQSSTSAPAATPIPQPVSLSPPGNAALGAQQRRVPMTLLRQKIAENLLASQQGSAHLTTFNEVDMSAVMQLRSSAKEQFEKTHGVRLGFMSFFIKAAVHALQNFPEVNAYVDGTDVIYNDFYNVGVAISTGMGLLVPVVRDCEYKTFADLEKTIIDFSTRAQKKRIMPDEFAGGTFTISNGGVFGSMLSTPIPSPPQTAILGMHTIKKRPMVINDEIVIRPMMYLALTYDHRILDGRGAIGFLAKIVQAIESPLTLLLDL